MEQKQLQLVTFEQAKQLKELGFNWPTTHFYIEVDENPTPYPFWMMPKSYGRNPDNWNEKEDLVSAPTVALALKWCRNEKGFDNFVYRGWSFERLSVFYEGKFCEKTRRNEFYSSSYSFDDYYLAESALLDKILTYLEK